MTRPRPPARKPARAALRALHAERDATLAALRESTQDWYKPNIKPLLELLK